MWSLLNGKDMEGSICGIIVEGLTKSMKKPIACLVCQMIF